MKEAILYKKIDNNTVKCKVCSHQCLIKENARGVCHVRQNYQGKLYSLVYGKIISEAVDPIEKKPLAQFLPGTFTYSYATVGCNFRCDNCQNWQISQYPKLKKGIPGTSRTPAEIIAKALATDCKSVSATYTEPTVFLEFNLEVMKLAHKKGLKNIWVSNGFMTTETLKIIVPHLDAINVDLKFFDDNKYKKYCGGRLKPILANLKYLKQKQVWVEVTTLIIPGLSDQEETFKKIATFIYNELGAETPWHVSRFFPEISYRLTTIPATPVSKIEQAVTIGKKVGLKNIYAGNI